MTSVTPRPRNLNDSGSSVSSKPKHGSVQQEPTAPAVHQGSAESGRGPMPFAGGLKRASLRIFMSAPPHSGSSSKRCVLANSRRNRLLQVHLAHHAAE